MKCEWKMFKNSKQNAYNYNFATDASAAPSKFEDLRNPSWRLVFHKFVILI